MNAYYNYTNFYNELSCLRSTLNQVYGTWDIVNFDTLLQLELKTILEYWSFDIATEWVQNSFMSWSPTRLENWSMT